VVDGLTLSVLIAVPFLSSGNRRWIPSTIEIVPFEWISHQTHIKSMRFEIQTEAFLGTDLTFVTFPSSVEVLGLKCFHEGRSLSSITFESELRLSRIEKYAFNGSGLIEIIFPP
jgi:hypothetical protein